MFLDSDNNTLWRPYMSEENGKWKSNQVMTWIIVISVTLATFYVVNHLVMSMQGLPLNWDLSPAQ